MYVCIYIYIYAAETLGDSDPRPLRQSSPKQGQSAEEVARSTADSMLGDRRNDLKLDVPSFTSITNAAYQLCSVTVSVLWPFFGGAQTTVVQTVVMGILFYEYLLAACYVVYVGFHRLPTLGIIANCMWICTLNKALHELYSINA